jgi:hypothetical protein
MYAALTWVLCVLLAIWQVSGQWYAVPCAQIHVYAHLSITVGLTA